MENAAANGQTPSGTSSPVDSSNPNNSPNTPPITDTPAGGGSKTVPSTVDSSSGGDKKSSIFKLVGFLLLVASYSLSAPAEILSRGTRRSKVMAARGFEMCLGLALVLMMWHGAQAQSGCTNALLSLSPCLNYVTGNTSTPSQSCCSQLDGVVKSTPQCLCSMMNGAGISMGISINQTLALRLPGAFYLTAVGNGPASSPALPPEAVSASSPGSPDDGSDESPSTTTAQSPTIPSGAQQNLTGTGSKTVPSTNTNTSAGNIKKPFNLSAGILFIAAAASILFNF